MTTKILLIGPTGRTGRLVLDAALERGLAVRGLEREIDDDFCDHENFEFCSGDLLEGDFDSAMDGVDCVISAVGLERDPQTLLDPPPLYTEGAVNIVRAMRRTQVRRLIVISAAFANPHNSAPRWFKASVLPLERVFRQMGEMERILRVCDDIEWTAVRPGWLLNRGFTGEYSVALDNLPPKTLRTRRADAAHFMLECALAGRHVREAPFIARRESLALETPPALIEELLPF